ncbi:MAG: cobalamin-dependent protein, partial [Pseudomonadota bacterium]
MRVAFVQNVWFDNLGPIGLAEILERQGHQVRFFLEDRSWVKRIVEWAPHVVALSATTGNHLPMLKMAEIARSAVTPRPVVILGGPHATFFPEVIHHPALDAICRGEGDLALPQFLAEMEGGGLPEKIPNFWIKKDGVILKNEIGPLVVNLDDIPFPRRTPLYSEYRFRRNYPVKTTVSSRGCPFGCIYCYNNIYKKMVRGKGPYVRRRSVSHLMEELLYLHKTYGFRSLEILDDIFTMDKAWTLDFAREYARKIRLPYAVLSSPGFLDPEIIEALKD